ncbi:sulfur carrier protein ThiS [Anaerostipes sp. MSJ-23]|uniref:sulfur carrier protein ThiS n=1 Tax=unclassified Anaerostipes TaxID=2635253 RepID=UPI001C114DD1|nr:sulfur carrier protein ThiS [Anaerostipes sp. MSJ-23]MBU5459710.1 sulfur carrier protein ThiS [Anaerostipes sp. MSJ-23]
MTVNGEAKKLSGDSVVLADFLVQEGYKQGRIAVEHNGRIVPKGEYGQVVLSDSDTLEVVTFVGGG